MFDHPLEAPTTLEFVTDSGRQGGALTGPLVLEIETAPITLQDWSEIGLGSWSGGIEYSTIIDLDDTPADRVLDLGAVRGSVSVAIDGEPVGSRFCGPWTVALGPRSGRIEVSVTVFNTLAPFLHASTPTTWTFPSQFASGLFGPVAISTIHDPTPGDPHPNRP